MARMSPKKQSSERAQKAVEHVGFEAAAEHAAQSYGGDIERGRAAIAAGARKASAAAKKRNPRLTKVAGVGKNKKAGAVG